MTPPPNDSLEVLYRKPGTITAAQVLMWIQFSFLVCCGFGGTFAVLFMTGIVNELGIDEDVLEGAENLVVLTAAVFAGVVAAAILFGVLAAKLGAGRRSAQVMTVVVMLGIIVFGFVGLYTQFEVEDYAGTPVDGSEVVGTLLALALPIVTLLCLCTGSANQWFRQGGRDAWPRYQPVYPPMAPPYR
ncbi:hypothetical protein [Glycomyces arizonensis]|uniref:hypothetical protein n=1 Tax=Glycomyces arizonensis TaxID=256035 RepID=UPI00047D6916|nr:hypothetical protein [Glycomyces arizonensis]